MVARGIFFVTIVWAFVTATTAQQYATDEREITLSKCHDALLRHPSDVIRFQTHRIESALKQFNDTYLTDLKGLRDDIGPVTEYTLAEAIKSVRNGLTKIVSELRNNKKKLLGEFRFVYEHITVTHVRKFVKQANRMCWAVQAKVADIYKCIPTSSNIGAQLDQYRFLANEVTQQVQKFQTNSLVECANTAKESIFAINSAATCMNNEANAVIDMGLNTLNQYQGNSTQIQANLNHLDFVTSDCMNRVVQSCMTRDEKAGRSYFY